MRTIARKLPEDLMERARLADTPSVSRAERLAEVSQRVRVGSMKVNAGFAAIETDPDV